MPCYFITALIADYLATWTMNLPYRYLTIDIITAALLVGISRVA